MLGIQSTTTLTEIKTLANDVFHSQQALLLLDKHKDRAGYTDTVPKKLVHFAVEEGLFKSAWFLQDAPILCRRKS